MGLVPTEKCGSFDIERHTFFVIIEIECEVMSSIYITNRERVCLKNFLLNADSDKILQTSPAALQGLKAERSEAAVVLR